MGLDRTTAHRALLKAAVVAHGSARLTREELAALRRRPDPLAEGWPPIGHATLRNSDDQTVAAVSALRSAIRRVGALPTSYEDWGVLAAPRFLGRSNLVVVLDRFKAEGVWGVTPHLIPHFALHSQAGTLSIVLGGHGPNLGIGGGLYAAADGVLTALTWLASGTAPGVWLVMTGWSPEYLPDLEGEPRAVTHCEALALGLTPVTDEREGRIQLQILESDTAQPPCPPMPGTIASRLEAFLNPMPAGPRVIGHPAHEDRTAPRPHLLRRPGRASLGTDATGRTAIEMVPAGSALWE